MQATKIDIFNGAGKHLKTENFILKTEKSECPA